jgi:Cu2+-exporting ATPase
VFVGERIVGGKGVEAESTTGMVFRLGALQWLHAPLSAQGGAFAERALSRGETVVGLMQEGEERKVLALFALGDSLRPEAKGVVQSLARRGVEVSLLSGDNPQVVRHIAKQLGLAPEVAHGELSPEEKERLVLQAGEGTVFVGDGVNDARALRAASVGVGITGGAEVCLKVADVFLTAPDLTLLLLAIDGAKRTERLVYRHLAISLVYNVTAATLAVLGFIGPLAAALVMPASSLSVISSSLAARPFSRRGRWE